MKKIDRNYWRGTKIRNCLWIRATWKRQSGLLFKWNWLLGEAKVQSIKIIHQNNISKIKQEKVFIKSSINDGTLKAKKRLSVTSNSLETAITTWIWDMYERKVSVSDELIQEKARRIQILLNQEIPEEHQLRLKFSSGWLQRLKIWNNYKCYKSHGKSSNVDQNQIKSELPVLQEKLKKYTLKDIWNADEFGLFYQMPPRETIAPGPISGRKKKE